MTAQLRLYDSAGTFVCLLPEWKTASCQDELNAAGAWSVTYPRAGKNADVLAAQADGQVAFLLDGTEVYRGLLEDDGSNDADPNADLTVSGRGLLAVLDRAITYPPNGAGTLPAEREFLTATPGTILGVLLSAAQARGGLTGLSWTFTGLVDSAGAPWPQALTVTYDAGISYTKVADGLVGQGVVELRAVGKTGGGIELQAYAPGTVLDRDLPGVLLHLGREGRSLPRQRSRREVASHVLVIGDAGANAERADPTTAATWGRREASLSQGNTTNAGTMAVLGDALLTQRARPMLGRTLAYDLAARDTTDATPTPRPWLDFRVGDRIRLAGVRTADGLLEPLRVRSCAASFTADGLTEPSVELGDLFVEATIRLARRIEGIVNGTVTTTGGAQGPLNDNLPPAGPTSCVVTSAAYMTTDGTTLAQATISWTQVTTNNDGTPLYDLAGYLVSYKVENGGWSGEFRVDETVMHVDNIWPGVPLQARVRAIDRQGNRSPWRESAVITSGEDATPPPAPSTPVLTAAVGGFRAAWDGLGSAGEVMPGDLAHVEVHVSTGGASFTPTTATLRDQLLVAGISPIFGDPFGTTLWVRFVAVDRAGNRSPASAAASGTPARVTGLDIAQLTIDTTNLGDQAVSEAKIKNLAVTTGKMFDLSVVTAKIANLAVDNAKIANVEIGKLVAGILTADLTVSSRIKTADTGARVELGATGLRAFNSAGTETVSITTTGAATFNGVVRTGPSGIRWELTPYFEEARIRGWLNNTDQPGEIRLLTYDETGAVAYAGSGSTPYNRQGLELRSPAHVNSLAIATLVLGAGDASASDRSTAFLNANRWVINTNEGLEFRNFFVGSGASGPMLVRHQDVTPFTNQTETVLQMLALSGPPSSGSGGIFGAVNNTSIKTRALFGHQGPAVDFGGLPMFLQVGNAGSGWEWQCRAGNYDTQTYGSFRAAAFNVHSQGESKREIAAADLGGALAKVATIKPRRFHFKHDPTRTAAARAGIPLLPKTLGFVAEELPAEVTTAGEDGQPNGYSIPAMLALLVAGQQESTRHAHQLEQRLAALEAA